MRRIIEIARVFMLIFVRDRVTLFFTFFFNAFLMILFGLTINDKYNLSFDIGVVDNVQNQTSIKIVSYLEKQPNMKLKRFEYDSALYREISNGKLVAGIVVNPKDVITPTSSSIEQLNVEILGDQSRNMWLKFLIPGIKLALTESNEKIKSLLGSTEISTRYLESRNLRYFDFVFPGLLIFSIMQIGLTGGLTLLGLRHDESIKRLKITPLKKYEFLLGYGLSYVMILFVQIAMFVVLGLFIFNYSFSGNLFLLIILIILSSVIFISLGILLSNWASTPEAGDNFNRLFSLPAGFLCGVYFPQDTLPTFVQNLTLIHPLTHVVSVFRGVANNSDNISTHTFSVIIIIFLLFLLSILSVVFFRWEEKTS
jgi:ABC-2 type transport system permease protein